MSDDPITTVQIRISRVIENDGRMAVHTWLPPDLNATEALGMLEMAKIEIYQVISRWRRANNGDD